MAGRPERRQDWSPRAAKVGDPSFQRRAEKEVEKTRNIEHFSYRGDVPLGVTWAFMLGRSRDSDLLEESNYSVIKKDLEERFPDDVEQVHSSHWAVGWVDELAVRMLNKKGQVTAAAQAAFEWQDKLEDYSVADEEDLSAREFEATLDNIQFEGGLDDWKAREVFTWLWDHDQRSVQSIEGQGGYPSEEAIEKALRALGYLKDEEEEPEEPPPPPYEHPGQLRLFGRSR